MERIHHNPTNLVYDIPSKMSGIGDDKARECFELALEKFEALQLAKRNLRAPAFCLEARARLGAAGITVADEQFFAAYAYSPHDEHARAVQDDMIEDALHARLIADVEKTVRQLQGKMYLQLSPLVKPLKEAEDAALAHFSGGVEGSRVGEAIEHVLKVLGEERNKPLSYRWHWRPRYALSMWFPPDRPLLADKPHPEDSPLAPDKPPAAAAA